MPDEIIFFAIGILAGLIESTSGGSGLIVLPTLLFSGVNPIVALGTSKLQYALGGLVSIARYHRANLTNLPHLKFYALVSALMGSIGALILVNIEIPYLRFIVPFLLLGSAIYFAISPRIKSDSAKPKMGYLTFALGPIALIGLYDGFLGTGSGSFFILALIWGMGISTLQATACTKIIDFSSSIAALAIMIWQDHVSWKTGLMLGGGQIIGAWFGAGLVINKGTKLLRPILIGVSILLCLKLLWDL